MPITPEQQANYDRWVRTPWIFDSSQRFPEGPFGVPAEAVTNGNCPIGEFKVRMMYDDPYADDTSFQQGITYDLKPARHDTIALVKDSKFYGLLSDSTNGKILRGTICQLNPSWAARVKVTYKHSREALPADRYQEWEDVTDAQREERIIWQQYRGIGFLWFERIQTDAAEKDAAVVKMGELDLNKS
ncbi:hypothetical protein PFICI_06478 [Pestalotiopsis fici W106-1]|uniref:Uncharacterized protein n=1 Tax=Pestalotiopsis fici (strain W106-1 / CGMCC3.15140) TaxID=1229662 RepID=W3X8F9_PESFW|nr:uncharacterized protein PFICI_06478 [Pestalotiopsis fici W106-1]ETS81476.1 hypothetical protein PFICI_06478 [Pestalotiopsis fici W106-1]